MYNVKMNRSERARRKKRISDLLIATTSVVRRHTSGHDEKRYGQGQEPTKGTSRYISVVNPNNTDRSRKSNYGRFVAFRSRQSA